MADVQTMIPGFPTNMVVQQVTIKSGASKSEQVATQGMALVGVQMPATWTAADLGCEASWDNNVFFAAYDGGGNAMTAVATANKFITFPFTNAVFAPFIKLTSVATGGGSVTPANQGADRTLYLIFRRLFS